MMYWNGVGTGWGIVMMVAMAAFWILVIGGGIFAITRLSRPQSQVQAPPPSAESILAERFASGQIDEQEYRSRLATLRAGAPVSG